MRKFFRFAAVVLVLLVVGAVFALRWAFLTGRAKRQAADAEYHTTENIRAIYHAEREYYIHHPYLGFSCAFSTLTAKPDPLLDDKFISGHVEGYTFTFSNCRHEENPGFSGNLTYHLTATPDPGNLPLPTFCVDDDVDTIPHTDMVIFEHPPIITAPSGSSACALPAQ